MIPLELFKKSKEEKLSAMEAQWVETQLNKYPYFSLLHFIHAKIAHHNNKDNAKDLASIASIYSNDRKKTANYIQQSLKTIFKPSSEIFDEIPVTEEKTQKVIVTKEYIPKGPRVGMIDWKIQTIIQIRVQMFLHVTKLLTQEMENFKKPKISKESNLNPLSLNLAENILNLLNINLLDLASNPNINPTGVIANAADVLNTKEKEQNIKGDTKTDFFAEKLAKLRETNEELKRLKKITSDSMKRFVEPNFDNRTYITELDEEVFNTKLEEQKQKAVKENILNPPIVTKQENISVTENQMVVQKPVETQTNVVEKPVEIKQEDKTTETKKQNIIQNVTSDSMKRFKPLTFEEEVPNNILETTQNENIETSAMNIPIVEENIIIEEIKTEKYQKTQEPVQNISSDSFKRFVPLEIEPTESTKKEIPLQKTETVNENIQKNISTDSFKRFVTPEFDTKAESLKSKNLEQPITPIETSPINQEVINEVVKGSKDKNKIESKKLAGNQDSLKRFVEPEFDNVIITKKEVTKKEDTSLSRFVKPEFDENSKKSFKTEETVIEVQSTKYVIELVVKKDKIHHYFKKDIVSKIIEVNPELTENPVSETVQENPVLETVQENPVSETVQESPVLETVQENPILETVQENPVLETIQESPVLETVQENPVLETIQENPVLETIQENPVLETIQENPVLETVQENPVLETVQENPVLETVQENPVLETVQESPVLETVQESPVLETVQESPVLENPVESEIQKPYHELINIERLENRIAGHKKKAEIIGKKAQVSSDITLKSLQNKFLQSIIKAKPDKKQSEEINKSIQEIEHTGSNKNIDDILEKIKQLENKFSSIQQMENKNDSFHIIEQENEETHDLSDEIITETMAKIFLVQGDILKSIKIYKKLIERNPKKREYYEQKIKEIESK